MLQQDGALLTWSLLELPDGLGGERRRHDEQPSEVAATRLPDHRLLYLDYEGPISNGRGSVTRMAAGDFSYVAESNAFLDVQLQGDKCTAHVQLRRRCGDEWTLSVVREPVGAREQ